MSRNPGSSMQTVSLSRTADPCGHVDSGITRLEGLCVPCAAASRSFARAMGAKSHRSALSRVSLVPEFRTPNQFRPRRYFTNGGEASVLCLRSQHFFCGLCAVAESVCGYRICSLLCVFPQVGTAAVCCRRSAVAPKCEPREDSHEDA